MFKSVMGLSVLLVISGCATQSTSCIHHVERDLTIPWSERTYWCAPPAYKNASIKRSVSPPKYEPTFQEQAQNIIDFSVAANHAKNGVRFYRHDYEYSKEDLNTLLSLNTPIKIRGCRLASESSDMNFGRALRVRNALRDLGFKHKVTILSDISCMDSKSVEII